MVHTIFNSYLLQVQTIIAVWSLEHVCKHAFGDLISCIDTRICQIGEVKSIRLFGGFHELEYWMGQLVLTLVHTFDGYY